MATAYTVHANWDADAGVFTTESDIPGLVIEAETFKEVVELVRALAPEVIATNVANAAGPHSIEIVPRRKLAVA